MSKSARDLGTDLEEEVNNTLMIAPVINSGASDGGGHSLGYDHRSKSFIGESKYKSNDKKPTITYKEFKKLKDKATKEGHKEWFFVVQFNEGKDTVIMLDFNNFASLTYEFWRTGG